MFSLNRVLTPHVIIVFAFVVFTFVAVSLTTFAQSNILYNGSFEQVNADGVPTPFRIVRYSGEAPGLVDSRMARTGQNSIRLEGDGSTRTSIALRTRLQGGNTYKVSAWYRHDRLDQGVQVGKTLLRLMAFDSGRKVNWSMDWIVDERAGEYVISGGENLHVYTWKDAPDEWAELTVTFTLPPNIDTIDLEAFNFLGQGRVWFDDFSITRLSTEEVN